MPTLTTTAYYTRKVVKYGSVVLVILIFSKVIIEGAIAFWKKIHPPAPPAPTVIFGKIPAIEFPPKENIGGLEYVLETPTGALPEFPDRAKVFFVPYQRPNLLALDRAKQEAKLMDFTNEPLKLSEKMYKWIKANNELATLEMDVFSGSFTYNYNWQLDQNILSGKSLPGKEQAKTEAINFLKKVNILEDDLLNGRAEVEYLKLSGSSLMPAVSPSEANFCRVDMFRQNVDELSVLTATQTKGIVTIMFSGIYQYEKRVVKVEFNYFPIKYDSMGTYPIKTAATALQELKMGQGFIARWSGSGSSVVIRRIYLAYYDSEKPQNYLQPIIVFEGDDNFFGYVSAVTAEWNL